MQLKEILFRFQNLFGRRREEIHTKFYFEILRSKDIDVGGRIQLCTIPFLLQSVPV
jgi:hypothetical protein